MMLPSIFGENLLDNWFDDGWNSWDYSNTSLMNTDIKENDNDYELTMNLPGVKKEDVTAELKDGYLTISASKGLDKDEQEKETGKYIRRERYAGNLSRSFYIGDVKQEDVKAAFKNGILSISVPKEDKKAKEEKKYITIGEC